MVFNELSGQLSTLGQTCRCSDWQCSSILNLICLLSFGLQNLRRQDDIGSLEDMQQSALCRSALLMLVSLAVCAQLLHQKALDE